MEKLFSAPRARAHRAGRIVTLLGVLAAMVIPMDCLAKGHVLIYTKNGKGYIHDNVAASVDCLTKICDANGWTYEATDDAAVFNTLDKVKTFDVLVFSNTNNETFDNDDQRNVFQSYIRGGGAFVAIHSACGSERAWPWFWANLGGKFVRHPKLQKFDIDVIDKAHPSTAHLPAVWNWEDEFYYMNELNPRLNILLAGDLRTLDDDQKDKFPGRMFGDYFPLAWSQEFDGGRQWYTALGHKIEYYKDRNFIKHLEGGIRWALTKTPAKTPAANIEQKAK
jgi:type 1 glutamine amidotransferase